MMLKYCTSTSPSFIASRAAASARTLKPMMRALEAAASCTSEMVMPPTPLAMIFTATSSVESLFNASRSASALPCTSVLSRMAMLPAFCSSICANTSPIFEACFASFTSRNLPWRYSATSRALRSFSTARNFVTGVRRALQAQHLHRHGRRGAVHRLAVFVEHGAHAPEFVTRDDRDHPASACPS